MRLLKLLACIFAALELALSVPAFAHGDLHEQIDALTEQIKKTPGDARLYLKRADLRRIHQEIGPSEADYRKAEQLDPTLHAVHLGRGKLLSDTGAYDQAREALDRFLEKEPDHLDGLVTRARLEVKRKRPLASAEDYARVLKHPGKVEVEYYHEYAAALASAGPEHMRKAIEILDAGIAKLGPVPTLQLQAIELEVANKDFASALERVDAIASRTERKEPWLERRGDILQKAGEKEQALRSYQNAKALVESLPARIRNRRATTEMERRLQAKIVALQ